MLPYNEAGSKLERLLEKLFEDTELPAEDVSVMQMPKRPPIRIDTCCTYNYSSY